MKVLGNGLTVTVELAVPEMRQLLEELYDVPGGSKLPKMRQLCKELEAVLTLRSWSGESRAREARAQARAAVRKKIRKEEEDSADVGAEKEEP